MAAKIQYGCQISIFRYIIVWKVIKFDQLWVNNWIYMQRLTSINFITLNYYKFLRFIVPKP